MDLLELISEYWIILRERGREPAELSLIEHGVHSRIRTAIMACFDDDGKRLGTGYHWKSRQHMERGKCGKCEGSGRGPRLGGGHYSHCRACRGSGLTRAVTDKR
jgi:hypothetical protein